MGNYKYKRAKSKQQVCVGCVGANLVSILFEFQLLSIQKLRSVWASFATPPPSPPPHVFTVHSY